MPDGTVGNDSFVTPDVPDTEAMLAALVEENKSLKSNIGRQNDIHGKRTANLENELAELKESLRRQEADRADREYRARYASMSPAEQAKEEARRAGARVQELESYIIAQNQIAQDQPYIQSIVEEAVKLGIDVKEIDTSSKSSAIFSFRAAKADLQANELERLKQELADVKKATVTEVADVVRQVTGQRSVATGTPRTVVSTEKEPADLVDLRTRLAIARKGGRGSLAEVLRVKEAAAMAGYSL